MVVMSMEKIRDKVNSFHSLNGSKLEECKALSVIKVTVNVTTEEIILAVDKVESHTVSKDTLNPNVFTSPTNLGFKMQDIFDLIPKFGIYHIIVGKNHTNIVPTFS